MRLYLINKKLVLSLIIVFVLSGSAFADSVTVCNNSLERTDSLIILNDITNLEQIRDKAGKDKLAILINNCAYTIILGQNSEETARILSNMVGKTLLSEKQKGASHLSYAGTDFIRSIDQTIDNLLLHKQPDKHSRIEFDLIPPSAFNSIKQGEQVLLVQNAINRPLFSKTAFFKKIEKLL